MTRANVGGYDHGEVVINGRTFRADFHISWEDMIVYWSDRLVKYGEFNVGSVGSILGYVAIVYKRSGDALELVWMGETIEKDAGHAMLKGMQWCDAK